MKRPRTSVPDEVAALHQLVERLDTSIAALGETLKGVERLVATTDEPPLMPNYQRAGEQLRVAVNAATGARRSLERRMRLQSAASRDALAPAATRPPPPRAVAAARRARS